MTEKDMELQELRRKLKAYEDTGLTPDAISGLCEMDKRSRMAKMLRWEEAEKDGRLVVLPCRVGDTVYRVFGGEIQTHCISNLIYRGIQNRWQIDCTPFLPWVYDDLGKTVFLTREEAEKALK